MTSGSHISIVVPVYNERENIGTCLRKLWAALKDVPHEILVCYDFDGDTTLVGIAEMPDAPPTLRLVKNTIGRGAANALRAGFIAATGDVVVTTMADLSDPPEVIPRMAEHMRRENLAVVAGSRYMRGGSQTGGPLLKRTMSHTAGVSLHWIAGVGTKDATSNFRAYSRRFLDATRIESRGGFEIALELTVKAHLTNQGVGEVPSSWTDRTAGESRFQLWKWLPSYLKWWLRAAWQPLLAWIVLAWMTIGAVAFVGTYASPVPMWDDLELVPMLESTAEWQPRELWDLHNEHRIPLPRVVAGAALWATHDVRPAMYLVVAALVALSLACMWAARKVRGRTWLVDAVFPLIYLNVGNAENLLMGFQLALILPTLFAGLALALVVARPTPRVGLWSALVIGACLIGLPLCGGPGLSLTPAVWSGVALLAAWNAFRAGPRARAATIVLVLAALATAATCVYYFVDFHLPQSTTRSPDLASTAGVAWRVLTLSLGPAGEWWWPWSAWIVGVLLAASTVLLGATWRRREQRHRVIALSCAFVGVAMLAASIGFGRGGGDPMAGFALRYVTLPAGVLAFTALAFGIFARPWLAWVVNGSLVVLVVCANSFVNTPVGEYYGGQRLQMSTEILDEVRSGMGPSPFLDKYVNQIHPDRGHLFFLLGYLARLELPPFRGVPAELRQPYQWHMFSLPPSRIDSPSPPAKRMIGGQWPVLAVPAGSTLTFPLHATCGRAVGSFGVPPALIDMGQTPGVRLDVELVRAEGAAPIALYSRTIDPLRVDEERGAQTFDVTFEPAAGQVLLLHVRSPGGGAQAGDWGYLGDVLFQ